jgi:hypothetical protein
MTQTPDFESIKQTNPYGVEYWSARDLRPLLDTKNGNVLRTQSKEQ